jgi:hypothetical protein
VLFQYLGSDQRQYMDYLDASTSRMLEAEPGGTYDIQVAPGRDPGLPLPPGDGRWTPAAASTPRASRRTTAPRKAESEPAPFSVLPSLAQGDAESDPAPQDQAATEAAPSPGKGE